jgi:hypothetical protein
MEAILQNFIGTTDEWESENPLLYDAVWAIEKTVTGKRLLKIGDGIHYWNDLDYVDTSYIKGLDDRLAPLDIAIQNEIRDRIEADNGIIQKVTQDRIDADNIIITSLAEETAARIELRQLVVMLREFIKDQMGPIDDAIQIVSQDLFYIVSQDNRVIVSADNFNF